ncbi:solute:sodium symporter family transporter [Thalassoroseus pseudoceratinae]|uniref:solute:sodium symporter family transporter n=1 Tax=Thalassoroseus pseudoceratinae TaxID=2713176 RepID=UPI0014217968|nr:solute:sodium symporter family transporter [Thalassoroseus pseudoceratinae]
MFFTLASFLLFTVLVAIGTWWLTRNDVHTTSAGYFLGGRSLTGGFIAGSLLLTNLSTEQLVGLNGAAYADGLSVMAWEVIAACSLVVMALIFLPRYLKSGIATVPQFLEERYNDTTRTITTLIFIVAYAVILLPIILYTGATGLIDILDLPNLLGMESRTTLLWIVVWMIGIIGSLYAIFGGLRTVAVSDTLNGFGLLIGGFLIAYLSLQAVNSDGIGAAITELREANPKKFNSLGSPDQSVPFSTLFTGVLIINLFYWCTNQQIIQRTFGATNLGEGQKGVLLAGLFKVLAPLILVLPGIIAFHIYGRAPVDDDYRPVVDISGNQGTIVASLASEDAPSNPVLIHDGDALNALNLESWDEVDQQVGETFTHNDQTFQVSKVIPPEVVIVSDGEAGYQYLENLDTTQYVSPRHKDQAYGKMVQRVLPNGLVGFFAAALMGAILSSFNSALNSTATLFSLGVYRDLIHKDATDEQVIRSGKRFGWIIAITSMCVAPLLANQKSIFGYLQDMNALYFIPIFAVVVVGFFTKRTPALAANIALILGVGIISAKYFVPPVAEAMQGLNNFHFLGIVFVGLIGLMLLIQALAPRDTPWEQQASGDVDLTPWKFAKPAAAGLILVVLAIYLYFADTSVLTQ